MSFTCPVCYEEFNKDSGKIPKILKCGDTICIICLQKIYKNNKIICPICTIESNDDIESIRINNFAYYTKNTIICQVCYKEFNNSINSERTPKVLKCGDTICLSCLKKNYNKENNEVFCTLCAKTYDEKLEDMPVNKCVIQLGEEELINNIEVLNTLKDKNAFDYEFSIGLMGESGVGKTCITHYFYKGKPLKDSLASIGCEYHFKLLKIKNKIIKIRLWDTAGQEVYRSATMGLLKGVDAVLIVFSLAERYEEREVNDKIITKEMFEEECKINSFKSVRSSYKQYSQLSDINEKIIYLIGNKLDDVENRVIKYEDALKLADDLKMDYFESSAMTGENINKIFFKLCITLMAKVDNKEKIQKNTIVINRLNEQNQNQDNKKCCK